MNEYHVYMLRCADGSYYTGVTNDVDRRLSSHVVGNDPSSYTFSRRPVALVYSAEFREVFDAISWEKQIKRWSRKKKEALIAREYDRLPGLSINFYRKRINRIMFLMHKKILSCVTLSSSKGDTSAVYGSTGSP